MVAGCLRILGVDMGVGLSQVNEDQHIARVTASRTRTIEDPTPQIVDKVWRILSPREEWDRAWGWKDVRAEVYAAEVMPRLRYPRIVIVFRDLAAISGRIPQHKLDKVQANFATALGTYTRIHERILPLDLPMALVSYERAVRRPKVFLSQLADFCGLRPTPEQIEKGCRYIRPDSGYQDMTEILREPFSQA